MLPRELRRSLNEQAYMTRGNNVKRFEQAFSLEKRYIKTLHYLQHSLAFSFLEPLYFNFFY
jgi:hypothetical protein